MDQNVIIEEKVTKVNGDIVIKVIYLNLEIY